MLFITIHSYIKYIHIFMGKSRVKIKLITPINTKSNKINMIHNIVHIYSSKTIEDDNPSIK